MGLPIITGGRSSSSRRLLVPRGSGSDCCHSCGRRSRSSHVAFGSNTTSSLTATLTVIYRTTHTLDEDDTDDIEFIHASSNDTNTNETTTTIAQIEICMTDSSTNSRKCISNYHIALPLATTTTATTTEQQQVKQLTICSNIIFSSNNDYIACLIPHDCCCSSTSSSTLVIFHLVDQIQNNYWKDRLILPSFLIPSAVDHTAIRAVQPRIVVLNNNHNLTCICNADDSLLLGCNTNGSIIAITWKRAKFIGVLFHDRNDTTNATNIICNMSYISSQQAKKRLALTNQNGSIRIYQSSSSLLDNTNTTATTATTMLCKMDHLYTIIDTTTTTTTLPYIDSIWINYYTLAVSIDTTSVSSTLQKQTSASTFTACQVWEIHSTSPRLLSSLSLNNNDILTTTTTASEDDNINNRDETTLDSNNNNAISIHHHHHGQSSSSGSTNAIVISSTYYNYKLLKECSFICVWDWNTSTLGFVLGMNRLLYWSRLISTNYFTIHHYTKRSNNSNQLETHTYEYSMLSSSSESCLLLLSGTHVSFTLTCHATLSNQATVSPDTTMDWKETRIPTTYTSIYGLVRLASMGRTFGRSIAVASCRGLCILDLSHYVLVAHPHPASTIYNKKHPQASSTVIPLPCIGTTTTCNGSTTTKKFGQQQHIIKHKKIRQIKWRMFNEYDESQFQVYSMAWWERNDEQQDHNNNNVITSYSEDLLFAVLEMMDSSNASKRVHLMCWSRRRLGWNTKDQLLVDVSSSSSSSSNHNNVGGILLPPSFLPGAISILPFTSFNPHNNNNNNSNNDERALLLISNNNNNNYVILELQIIKCHDTNSNFTSFTDILDDIIEPSTTTTSDGSADVVVKVLGRLSEGGGILIPRISSNKEEDDSTSTTSSLITGIFLAGGSFDFDLIQETIDNNNKRDANSYFVTLGICTLGDGLHAIAVTANLEKRRSVIGPVRHQSGVAHYWQSNTIHQQQNHTSRNTNGQFVWTICFRDGIMVLWSVPFFTPSTRNTSTNSNSSTSAEKDTSSSSSPDQDIFSQFRQFTNTTTSISSSFNFPALVSSATRTAFEQSTSVPDGLLGEVYIVDSTMSNYKDEGDNYLVGPLPSSSFISSVGQRSRHFNCQGQLSSSNQDTVFSIANCALGPPSHTITLLSFISQIVALRYFLHSATADYYDATDQESAITKLRSIVLEITKLGAFDQSLDAALRLIIIFAVDMIHDGITNSTNMSTRRDMLTLLLRETITVARESLNPLNFSFFFLSIARQLEPRHFNILFPLRFSTDSSWSRNSYQQCNGRNINNEKGLSVENLFMESIGSGSIAFAAAGLPLFHSQVTSHRACVKMLLHCLEVVAEDCASSAVEYHRLEEHAILRELFQYGLKVEDSLKLCNQSRERGQKEEISRSSANGHEIIDSGMDNSSSATKPGIFSKISSRLASFIPPTSKQRISNDGDEMDKEILDAAHSFIFSGFPGESNGPLLDATAISGTPTEENFQCAVASTSLVSYKPWQKELIQNHPIRNVKLTVASFIASTLFSRGALVTTSTCWKELAFISKILSNGSNSTMEEGNNPAFCREVSRSLQNNTVIANMICVTTEELQQVRLADNNNYLFKFLLSHLLECSRQIGKRSCAFLFSFTTVLLEDLSRSSPSDFDTLKTELAIILLITGYLTGDHYDFIANVLDKNESIMKGSFEMAANAFPNVV